MLLMLALGSTEEVPRLLVYCLGLWQNLKGLGTTCKES